MFELTSNKNSFVTKSAKSCRSVLLYEDYENCTALYEDTCTGTLRIISTIGKDETCGGELDEVIVIGDKDEENNDGSNNDDRDDDDEEDEENRDEDCFEYDCEEVERDENVDKIINELTDIADCVYKKLVKQNGNLFKNTIGKFDNNSKYNIIFKQGTRADCGNRGGVAGCTDPKDLKTNGSITIYIVDNAVNGLEMAATLLHEAIHAEIYRYVDEHHNTSINPNDRVRLWQLYAHYKAQNGRDIGTVEAQHRYMTEKYVTPIAETLRQLDANRFDLSHYKPFAWQGLKQYGLSGYYENGELVYLDDSQFSEKLRKVLNSTTFSNDCN